MVTMIMAGCGGSGGADSTSRPGPVATIPGANNGTTDGPATGGATSGPGTTPPGTGTGGTGSTDGSVDPTPTTPIAPVTPVVPTTPSTPATTADYTYQAEDNFHSGGVRNAGTYLQAFSTPGARVIFTVNAATAGTVPVSLHFANGTATNNTLNIYVNGVYAATTTLAPTASATTWKQQAETLALRAGLNTISYQMDAANTGLVNIDAVSVQGGVALATRGATLPYEEYEAESGSTNAVVSTAGTTYKTAEAESSGRQHVTLSATGQYVEWVATRAANALTVRYSMPDASAGGGTSGTLSLYVNGIKVRSLDLSSKYAWVYGAYPFHNTPSHGDGHRFFDESSFVDLSIAAGSRVRLQKDAADTASYYKIDLVDMEWVDPAYAMPANFVSVASYGAVANDGIDDTAAINQAISAAKASGKGVWLPAGTFNINAQIGVSGVQVRGAGMWRTTLQGSNGKGGFIGKGSNVTIADLALKSDSTQRNDSADNPGFEGSFGTGSLIQNVWVEHMKVGIWTGIGTNGLLMVNGRIRDTWADGVNLAGGVLNTTVSHFNLRNTGDDSMAMFSDGRANTSNSFRYNTAQLPILANTFAIYGGTDNKLLDNIGADTVTSGAGIAISRRFNAVDFAGTTEVRRNTLHRTGSYEYGFTTQLPALWIYAYTETTSPAPVNITAPVLIDTLIAKDSTYDGMLVSYGSTVSNLTLNNIQFINSGAYGMNFSNVTGTGNFSMVHISGSRNDALNNPHSQYTIVRGSGNSGW